MLSQASSSRFNFEPGAAKSDTDYSHYSCYDPTLSTIWQIPSIGPCYSRSERSFLEVLPKFNFILVPTVVTNSQFLVETLSFLSAATVSVETTITSTGSGGAVSISALTVPGRILTSDGQTTTLPASAISATPIAQSLIPRSSMLITSAESPTPITLTTGMNGMVIIILIDEQGNTVYQFSTTKATGTSTHQISTERITTTSSYVYAYSVQIRFQKPLSENSSGALGSDGLSIRSKVGIAIAAVVMFMCYAGAKRQRQELDAVERREYVAELDANETSVMPELETGRLPSREL